MTIKQEQNQGFCLSDDLRQQSQHALFINPHANAYI